MTPEDLIAKWENRYKHLSKYIFEKIQAKEWTVNEYTLQEIAQEIAIATYEASILRECIDDLKVVKFIQSEVKNESS